jgi:hypothetical protein
MCGCDCPPSLNIASVASDLDKTYLSTKLRPKRGTTPVRLQILETLASSHTRLSRPKVLAAMNKAGLHATEQTLRIELRKMHAARWVDTNQGQKPRGFRITTLGRSILETIRVDSPSTDL